MDAARIPGMSTGMRIFVKTFAILAQDILAASWIVDLICSMKGVIVMITKGIEGARLTRMTAVRVRPSRS
jgi:hypothetical protein